MGHKVNPLGFRLGITQKNHSVWFVKKRLYPKIFQEDVKIHKSIENYFQRHQQNSYLGIARIEIERKVDLINVIIFTGFSSFLNKEKGKISSLKNEIRQNLGTKKKLNVKTEILKKPYQNAKILVEFIASQLEKRVAVKKILQKAVELAQKEDIEGIRIRIAGRLGGRERTRKTKKKIGRVTLQTLRAEMNYCSYTVRTIHGTLGIQLWIFMKEQ
uniref:Small ribosomal subunit protein uS3c n=1 Tax=Welwitschia mirabilis TaxID=3377 RepID=B2Y1Z8_WELMI|nr:ribosomal protein S3 [Welwitschia mirabilis]ABY26828.1 ribosomal protein S3 [Welwitschia mirabilis]AMA21031.1 ribosomal protein S3 [Welwitschia mirabilis]BAH11190.1 ribosomal protein S3 [Welwitschia mirabilis]|eukprot:TRINITY_DN138_c0_g4_i1.p3 TRINITY_DN138_c0_g4~~TRINITY_DN138_c0_g4_i1.p3  ORF type:complete len:215 (-),score=17.44 TRINITY_DN138_c0_g4_i1:5954-6598(-)